MRPILIVGCGRSGTQYTSKIFGVAGVDLGHELLGKDGMSSWLLSIGKSDVRPPNSTRLGTIGVTFDDFLNHYKERPVILHQVRHPLKVISSFVKTRHFYWKYVCDNVPELTMRDKGLLRSMKYWLLWNQKAEKLAAYTYKVEDFFKHTAIIFGMIGRPYLVRHVEEMKKVEKTVGHRVRGYERKYILRLWYDLHKVDRCLCDDIMTLAKKYGYTEEELNETS